MTEICGSCNSWCGRCLLGKHWPLSSSPACDKYEPRSIQIQSQELKK